MVAPIDADTQVASPELVSLQSSTPRQMPRMPSWGSMSVSAEESNAIEMQFLKDRVRGLEIEREALLDLLKKKC